MKVKRAYKFRLYPTKEQEHMLVKTFGCCRLLWNKMVAERKGAYEKLKDKKEELYTHTYKTEKEYKQHMSIALTNLTRDWLSATEADFS